VRHWIPITCTALAVILFGLSADADPPEQSWSHPLQYQGKLNSPLVEVTPFVFNDRFYRLDNWQKQWDHPEVRDGSQFTEDEIRIVDMATEEIISIPLIGHGLGMALVVDDRVYVFGSYWGEDKKWNVNEISMVSSQNLKDWTEPVMVLKANEDERFFNVSVCRGPDDFIMLVESNDPKWPAFTFKYFRSHDLVQWEQIPDALYGVDKYVGGPALYYEGGMYYTLYLEALGNRFWETRVTRSSDLIHWEDAPEDRPFVTYNPANTVHPLMPPEARERNASDAEMCYWDGKTIVYFTGGIQKYAGDLQWATFEGTPRELLERFYE
jgi:alpha-L-fucosidase